MPTTVWPSASVTLPVLPIPGPDPSVIWGTATIEIGWFAWAWPWIVSPTEVDHLLTVTTSLALVAAAYLLLIALTAVKRWTPTASLPKANDVSHRDRSLFQSGIFWST